MPLQPRDRHTIVQQNAAFFAAFVGDLVYRASPQVSRALASRAHEFEPGAQALAQPVTASGSSKDGPAILVCYISGLMRWTSWPGPARR
jgi:hypothetical protein